MYVSSVCASLLTDLFLNNYKCVINLLKKSMTFEIYFKQYW
jgi:hypothetical protein